MRQGLSNINFNIFKLITSKFLRKKNIKLIFDAVFIDIKFKGNFNTWILVPTYLVLSVSFVKLVVFVFLLKILQFFQVRLSLQSEEESEEIAERFLAKDIQANEITCRVMFFEKQSDSFHDSH
jgi:hypothetical protein